MTERRSTDANGVTTVWDNDPRCRCGRAKPEGALTCLACKPAPPCPECGRWWHEHVFRRHGTRVVLACPTDGTGDAVDDA